MGCRRSSFESTASSRPRSSPASGNGTAGWFTTFVLVCSGVPACGRWNSDTDFHHSICCRPQRVVNKYQVLQMSLLEGAIELLRSFLTFYVPVFFTFRYLMLNDSQQVRTILKFWCILVLYYLAFNVVQLIIKGYLALVIDLAALFFLNFNSYVYSEKLYDSFVSPFYHTHQESIQKYTEQLQKLFQKNSEQLKSKVASTAGDKIKNFMGEVLVGVLNPKQKSEQSLKSSQESRDLQEEEEEDQKEE